MRELLPARLLLWLLDHVDGLPVSVGCLDNTSGHHHIGLQSLPVVGHAKVALGNHGLESDLLWHRLRLRLYLERLVRLKLIGLLYDLLLRLSLELGLLINLEKAKNWYYQSLPEESI